MTSLTDLCTKHFNCSSLYDVLGVSKSDDEAAGRIGNCFCKVGTGSS